MVGLVSPRIFCLTSAFSCQLDFCVCCCTHRVAVVCHGFISVVHSDGSMAIVLNWIVCVLIEGRLASARMAPTGVVRSCSVMAHLA